VIGQVVLGRSAAVGALQKRVPLLFLLLREFAVPRDLLRTFTVNTTGSQSIRIVQFFTACSAVANLERVLGKHSAVAINRIDTGSAYRFAVTLGAHLVDDVVGVVDQMLPVLVAVEERRIHRGIDEVEHAARAVIGEQSAVGHARGAVKVLVVRRPRAGGALSGAGC